jgi:putative transposase
MLGSYNWTHKAKGWLNRKAAPSRVLNLKISAKQNWRKLFGSNRLPEVIQGVEFKDAIKHLSNIV